MGCTKSKKDEAFRAELAANNANECRQASSDLETPAILPVDQRMFPGAWAPRNQKPKDSSALDTCFFRSGDFIGND